MARKTTKPVEEGKPAEEAIPPAPDQYDAQDRVKVAYRRDATGPGLLAGKLVYPGETHVVTFAAYRKVQSRRPFVLIGPAEEGSNG